MNRETLFRPLAISLVAGVAGLFLQTIAVAQQTIAFGGTTDGGAAVYTVVLSGSPLGFGTPTLVNSNPEPWAIPSLQNFSPAVSALTFASNTASGALDLIGANSSGPDLYRLAGPSYATSTQFPNTGPQGECSTYANSVGVEPSGTIVGVGPFSCGGTPFVFIDKPAGWVSFDDLNHDNGLGTWTGPIANVPDAVIASGNFGPAQVGDALVLVGDSYTDGTTNPNKPVVVRYPQSSITGGSCTNCGQTLVTEHGFYPYLSVTPLVPVTMDISPIDGSLLIGTSDGSIWQLPWVTSGEFSHYGTPTRLVSAGVAWGKIRAIQQSGQLYYLATVPAMSQVRLYGIESFTSVTVSGLQPMGLAVPAYKTGTSPASSCIATPNMPLPNCDPLGDGVEKITIRGNTGNIPPNAPITEQECVVAVDPRIVNNVYQRQPLPLVQVCPGLSDSTIIPDYAHGDPGFVIIAALADQVVQNSNGIEVRIKSDSSPIFGASAATCTGNPQNVHLLASNDNSLYETTFAEGHNAFENTGFCDPDPGSGSLGPHKTIDGINFVLDLTSFAPSGTPQQQAVKFTDFKFRNLVTTIKQTRVRYAWEQQVLLIGAAIGQHLVDVGRYDCAAELVYLLDHFVRRHRGDFLPNITPTVREPNGFGDITGRLANIFATIEHYDAGKTITWTDWPLTSNPHLCHTNECNVFGMDK